jgi:hypothetical protein
MKREEQGPVKWIRSRASVDLLVRILTTEKSEMIVDQARKLLARFVPDVVLRDWGGTISSFAIKKDDPKYALLLGRVGGGRAVDTLRVWATRKDMDAALAENVNLALARLGDTDRSIALIRRFEKGLDVKEQDATKLEDKASAKADLAAKLGYVADAGCVMALARAYKNDLHYEKHGSDFHIRISLRDAVARALASIWPDCAVFRFPPETDAMNAAYHARVQKWLDSYLGKSGT